jgi:hypothetical protein
MPVKNPSERRGVGSNQYQDKPPRPINPDEANRNNNRSRSSRSGVGQLASRTPEEWVEECERLIRKQARLSKDLDGVYARMQSVEPLSDEYYDTLDKVDDLERDLEIVNQEIYEASIHAEGRTAADVAATLPGRLTEQYLALDGALTATDGTATVEVLWGVEGALTATRRDIIFLNRQGILKGAHVNEFCEKVGLHAAQLRRLTTHENLTNASHKHLTEIQTSVAELYNTAKEFVKGIRH